jgi:hypothetical protein
VSDPTTINSPLALQRHYEAEIARLRSERDEIFAKYDAAESKVMRATMIVDQLQTHAILSPDDQATHGVLHAIQRLKPALGITSPTPNPQPAPAAPVGDDGFTDAELAQIMHKHDQSTIKDAIHQAHYTIEFMQLQAAEGNYESAFDHLAVVLVNHNIALSTMHKGATQS